MDQTGDGDGIIGMDLIGVGDGIIGMEILGAVDTISRIFNHTITELEVLLLQTTAIITVEIDMIMGEKIMQQVQDLSAQIIMEPETTHQFEIQDQATILRHQEIQFEIAPM
jgi:hypothetical protein